MNYLDFCILLEQVSPSPSCICLDFQSLSSLPEFSAFFLNTIVTGAELGSFDFEVAISYFRKKIAGESFCAAVISEQFWWFALSAYTSLFAENSLK